MNQMEWLGQKIDKNRIKPNEGKVVTILKLKQPDTTKEPKLFLRAMQ